MVTLLPFTKRRVIHAFFLLWKKCLPTILLVRFSPKLLLLRFSLHGSLAMGGDPHPSNDSLHPTSSQNKKAMVLLTSRWHWSELWGWNLKKFYNMHMKIVSLLWFLSVDPIATLQVKREESSSSSPSHKTRCFYKRSQMNCEEGETNINGINNDSIVGQSASKIDPTQCAVMSGEKWMPRKFHCKILVGVKANSWRFCLHLPLSLRLLSFSFSLSPQFLSDRTKTILPFPPTRFQADR